MIADVEDEDIALEDDALMSAGLASRETDGVKVREYPIIFEEISSEFVAVS